MHGKRCNVMKQLKGSQFSETWTETAAGVFVDIGIALLWADRQSIHGKAWMEPGIPSPDVVQKEDVNVQIPGRLLCVHVCQKLHQG